MNSVNPSSLSGRQIAMYILKLLKFKRVIAGIVAFMMLAVVCFPYFLFQQKQDITAVVKTAPYVPASSNVKTH